MAKMTAKQMRFCDEYLIDLNATQAAIRAGYSPKTAYSIGVENLKKPELKNYIDEQLERIRQNRQNMLINGSMEKTYKNLQINSLLKFDT